MIIDTFPYLWSASAVDAVAALVERGHDTFEIPVSSPHCWPAEMTREDRSEGAAAFERLGARIRSLNVGGYDINLASPAANMRRKSVEHVAAAIELAEAWGATDLVISPGTRRPMISPSLDDVRGWLLESLDQLIPLAKKAGARLLFEQTPYCFTPTIRELAQLVETVDDDALKIVYDVANAAFIGEDPAASLLAYRDSIGLVHASDTGTDEWGHDPIGTGVIDFRAVGEAVEATVGFDNAVLEVIREEDTLNEFDKALRALKELGWKI